MDLDSIDWRMYREPMLTETEANAFAARHFSPEILACRLQGARVTGAVPEYVTFAIECREERGWAAIVRGRGETIEARGLLVAAAIETLRDELRAMETA